MSARITGRPVPHIPIEFTWNGGLWRELFDKQVQFIQQDMLRALADGKFIVYLSCPISSRGGSYFGTNVEISQFTEARLAAEWGPRFWILNPTRYQMESNQGLGLIRMHAYQLGLEKGITIDVDRLMREEPIGGSDYMRMWTRVLAEDGNGDSGGRISAYYFLGTLDVRAFFRHKGAGDLTTGIEGYFAAKCAADSTFRNLFSSPQEGRADAGDDAAQAARRREEFFRFYAVRASAYYSKGSHDEWNIWQAVNAVRVVASEADGLGFGSQITGFFEGQQIDPGAIEMRVSRGYAASSPTLGPASSGAAPASPTGQSLRPPAGASSAPLSEYSVADEARDREAIVKMYEEALKAFRCGDLETVLAHWEDDGAYLWPAVPPAIGKQEISAAYEAFFQKWTADEEFFRHELTVSGDLAFSRFGTRLSLSPKSGGLPTHMTLQGTHVYRRRPDGWRFKIVIAINVPEEAQ